MLVKPAQFLQVCEGGAVLVRRCERGERLLGKILHNRCIFDGWWC